MIQVYIPKYFLGFTFRWGFNTAIVDHISITKEGSRYGRRTGEGSRWAADEEEIDEAILSTIHPEFRCEYCDRVKDKRSLGYYCPRHG